MKITRSRKMNKVLFSGLIKFFVLIIIMITVGGMLYAQTSVTPVLSLNASGISDQDDMCIWIHPIDKTQSTIIASDKSASVHAAS